MNSKVKGVLSIFFMSVIAYMMITTKYTHALGDYVLEFVGLKPWTSDYSGTHLTVIYFGILFVIGLFLVRKYAINNLRIRRRNVFIIFVAFMIVFSSITGITARNIKKNSPGVMSIGYNSKDSSMNYSFEDKKFIEFTAEVELTNYSDEKRTFYLSMNTPFHSDDGMEEIRFYTFEGKQAIFDLEGYETKTFSINLESYKVVGESDLQNVSGSGIVKEVILTDDMDNKVRLDYSNFFGVELGR